MLRIYGDCRLEIVVAGLPGSDRVIVLEESGVNPDESIATTDVMFFHSVMNEHAFRNNRFKTVAGTRLENLQSVE